MKLSVGPLFSSSKSSTKKKQSRSIARSESSSFGSNVTNTNAGSSSEDSVASSSSSSTQRCATPKSVLPPRDCEDSHSSSSGELFSVFDGKITRRELEAVLGRLGPDPPAEEELAAMLADLDGDGDGCVTLEELGALGTAAEAGDEPLRDAFKVFDADGDGRISAEELLGVFAALGDAACTLDECHQMIAGVDTDGDGFVCFQEFARMMDGQR